MTRPSSISSVSGSPQSRQATSVTWLFPGERVRIDVACLDCGDPLTVEMLDGRLTRVDPPAVVGHLNYGFGPSRGRPAFL